MKGLESIGRRIARFTNCPNFRAVGHATMVQLVEFRTQYVEVKINKSVRNIVTTNIALKLIFQWSITSHSAYVATSTESHGVKIHGFLYPNFM